MKPFILALSAFFITLPMYSQATFKTFCDGYGMTVDSIEATYYTLVHFDSSISRYSLKEFYIDGKLNKTGLYIDRTLNIPDGEIKSYSYTPYKLHIENYDKGKLKNYVVKNEKGDTISFKNEEIKTTEITKESAPILNYDQISKELVYPIECRKNKIEGRVEISVLIDSLGNHKIFRVLSYKHRLLALAAIEALKKIKSIPANINGKPISCWAVFPITFKLD